MLHLKIHFVYLKGGGKKQCRGAEKQSQEDRGRIANAHLDFYFTKNLKRILCMNLTMEHYECIHVTLGVEKQKAKPIEIKENQ